MSPNTIYTLYEVTNQTKKILSTYPDDSDEIILNGHYIHLFMKLNDKHLETKEEYDEFQKVMNDIMVQPLETLNEKQRTIRNFYNNDIKVKYDLLPNYDLCRWSVDLLRFKNLKRLHLSYLYLYEVKNIHYGILMINIESSFLHQFSFIMPPKGAEMNGLERILCASSMRKCVKKICGLPSSLNFLSLINNQLTKLPQLQHTSLVYLNFTNNNISTLPFLPDSIQTLCFNYNKIINIPNFPKSLKHLECSWNRIHFFTSPMSKDIKTIICDNNQIYQLPCLSELHNLKTLSCNSNVITELPPLPGLIEYINFSDNPIQIFVPFPFSLIE